MSSMLSIPPRVSRLSISPMPVSMENPVAMACQIALTESMSGLKSAAETKVR